MAIAWASHFFHLDMKSQMREYSRNCSLVNENSHRARKAPIVGMPGSKATSNPFGSAT